MGRSQAEVKREGRELEPDAQEITQATKIKGEVPSRSREATGGPGKSQSESEAIGLDRWPWWPSASEYMVKHNLL